MGQRIYFNNGWRYSEKADKEMLTKDFDDSAMTKIRIPHTCKEVPFNYFHEEIYQMESLYRKVFSAPKEWKGKIINLTFEAVSSSAVGAMNIFLTK